MQLVPLHGGVGRDGNDADALPLHATVPVAHSGATPLKGGKGDSGGGLNGMYSGGGSGSPAPRSRRKSRNPSVMEVVAKVRAESDDWCP
jgi:hypothetical protein